MGRKEALRLTGRFKPFHLSLSLPDWLVRNFRPVLRHLLVMLAAGHDLRLCCAVAGKPVGDHDAGRLHLLFSSLRSSRLTAYLSRRCWTRISSTIPVWSTACHSQYVTPQILSTTSSKYHLSPIRGGRRRIWLANDWLSLRAHCPIAEDDAAGRQHLLNHAQAQREPKIEPYRVADDLSGVTMDGINRIARCRHPAPLPDQPGSTKPAPGQLDGAQPPAVPSSRLTRRGPDLRPTHLNDAVTSVSTVAGYRYGASFDASRAAQ